MRDREGEEKKEGRERKRKIKREEERNGLAVAVHSLIPSIRMQQGNPPFLRDLTMCCFVNWSQGIQNSPPQQQHNTELHCNTVHSITQHNTSHSAAVPSKALNGIIGHSVALCLFLNPYLPVWWPRHFILCSENKNPAITLLTEVV